MKNSYCSFEISTTHSDSEVGGIWSELPVLLPLKIPSTCKKIIHYSIPWFVHSVILVFFFMVRKLQIRNTRSFDAIANLKSILDTYF